jgi:hypothetical protein
MIFYIVCGVTFKYSLKVNIDNKKILKKKSCVI